MRPVSGRGSFFQTVRGAQVGRSVFDMSHEVHTTCNYGLLYPVYVQEGLPGDVLELGCDALIRQQPTISPVMGRITATFHLFFVPKRLVWHNYERYITRGVDGMTVIPHVMWPEFQSELSVSDGTTPMTGVRSIDPNAEKLEPLLGYVPKTSPLDIGTLWDHFGLPVRCGYGVVNVGTPPNTSFGQTTIPNIIVDDTIRRGYCMIWNDYYRDENLVDPIRNINGSGQDELEQFEKFTVAACYPVAWQQGNKAIVGQFAMMWLLPRAWKKDYFTSALPWQQRGISPAIPLSGTVSAVWSSDLFDTIGNASGNFALLADRGASYNGETGYAKFTTNTATKADDIKKLFKTFNANHVEVDKIGTISMNDWYVANGTQKWMEYQAKGGARLIETLQAQWGVSPSDARLQRPEYIGGCKIPVVVSEVVQTSDSGAGNNATPLGTMAGHGMSVSGNYIGKYRSEEYGWFIGLLSFETSTGYQQGFPREMTRTAALEEVWPVFANLPEQAILEREIFVPRNDAESPDSNPHRVFGFQARYNECRVRNSYVTGQMRVYDNADYVNGAIEKPAQLNGVIPGSLSHWNFARYFSRRPLLNWYFMVCQPRMDNQRVTNEPPFIVQWANNARMVRRLPYVPEPGIRA